MVEITVNACVDKIAEVVAFVEEQLENMGAGMKAQMQISIAVDELFANIANYAYPNGEGTATVRVEASEDGKKAVITFIDSGVPYNPLEKEDPDITLSAEDRPIGGLGIFMVKKSMDDMIYRYENKKNILSIIKSILP
ncbi:MAG: ATP-binding protein [Clostridiales bacterium]|nr:ATP-binding protein [Clostridiales bacterium]